MSNLVIKNTHNSVIAFFSNEPNIVALGKDKSEALENLKKIIQSRIEQDNKATEELHQKHRCLWNY